MPRKKITYIVSRVDRALEFEWAAELLDKEKFELSFIILGSIMNTKLKQRLDNLSIECHEIYLNTKANYPTAIYSTFRILRRIKPNMVHCHLIDGTLIGFIAAKLAGVENKIYTRHHSTFHHQYAPHAIKYDVWANRNADAIVAISGPVYEVLTNVEHVNPNKVHIIPHGFPSSTFEVADITVVSKMKSKYELENYTPIIGVVSRYDNWKGVDYIILAFKEIIVKYPNAKLILANASKGDSVEMVKGLLRELPTTSYCEIDFEPDNKSLFRCMDMFIHVPVDKYAEAFGQVYVEAMAQRVPVIATQSGVGLDLMDHFRTGYVVGYKNVREILDGVDYVLQHPEITKEWTTEAFNEVSGSYRIERKINLLETLYSSI